MEAADSILDAIHEEVSFEDGDDVEMMDVEEGEVVERQISGKISQVNSYEVKGETRRENAQGAKNMNKKRKKKKKNKKKKGDPVSNGINIDRFVLDICKRLREKKSYLVYTAVGVLGVSALSDLVKEVDAVQACGGQKTAEGNRFRTGGGILWNILKVRDPNAFKEIMKKGKDFEKQFKRPTIVQPSTKIIDNAPQSVEDAITGKKTPASDDDVEVENPEENQPPQTSTEEKRRSVRDRLRVPVSYDDLLSEEPPKDHQPDVS